MGEKACIARALLLHSMVLKLFIKVLIKISVIPLQYFHPLSASTNEDHIVQVVQGNDVLKNKPSRVYRKGPVFPVLFCMSTNV